MKKIQKIHFVGVKGVGMTPLAIIAKQAGLKVTGCDIESGFITDESLKKAGITPFVGFDISHIKGNDLVITTGAHGGLGNIENLEAKKMGIPVWTQGEALGNFMKGEIFNRNFYGISVSGTHGKTTVSALVSTILKGNNLDPTYLVGTGSIASLGLPGHFGKGKFFVAEADEYATEPRVDRTPKFLWQNPHLGVITNIDYDHPDIYKSIEEIKSAFLKFSKNIDASGALVACIEDEKTREVIKEYNGRKITYGFSKDADYFISRITQSAELTFFWVNSSGTSLGEFSINAFGQHNALNALCAIVVCLELGLSVENIKKGLLLFKGTKRRAEFVKKLSSGATLYDDYAHHPTEIKKTLEGFRKAFPDKKIVCIFQPHTYSRTKELFEQFKSSFVLANSVILTDIYSSKREIQDKNVSSELLARAIAERQKNVLYIENPEDVVKYLDEKSYGRDYIILTMGAGDIYKIADSLG